MQKHVIFGLLACCLFSISSAQSLISLDTDFVTFETLSLDPYGLLDLTLSKRLSPKAQLSLQLFNTLNTGYVEIIGFSTRGRNLSLAYQVRI